MENVVDCSNERFYKGIFIEELRNRFLCTVLVNGERKLCYIPSSCRLSNFINLKGKEVLLQPIQGKNARTEFAVYAVKFYRNYLVLKTSEANSIVQSSLKRRLFSYLGKRHDIEKEKVVAGYKTDLYISDSNTIIEVKSIISTLPNAVFPTVFSQRAVDQLEKISELLDRDLNVTYIFISLNPYVKRVCLSDQSEEQVFTALFRQCCEKGMICKAYTAELKKGKAVIRGEIPVLLSKRIDKEESEQIPVINL